MTPSAHRAPRLGYTTARPAAAAAAIATLSLATAAAAAGALPRLPLLFIVGLSLCASQLGSIDCCVPLLLLLLLLLAAALVLLPAVLAMMWPWGLLGLLLPAHTQRQQPHHS
jgi:hypothetical protein